MIGRHYVQEIPVPDTIPAALADRLARTGWTWADKFRRNAILSNYRPKLAIALAQDFMAVARHEREWTYEPPEPGKSADQGRWRNSWQSAEGHIASQHRELQKAHLSRAFDEQEIRDYAESYARICSKMLTREHRADFVLSQGGEPPEGGKITDAGACARMDDPQWWRRQLRRTWTRRAENVMREMGIVRKGREPYASDDAVRHRHAQKVRGRSFLEKHAAVNEAGEQLNLLEVVKGSVSNPAIRRAEFMTRVRGFEEIADDLGHVAQFWTLTAPSIYHATRYTGEKNPNFNGDTPREAQDWLCKQWARVRAKLKRLSILMYGFRIAEPHHDATPHWHLLMFCREADAATIATVIRAYWMKEHAEELGPRDPQTGHRPKETARCKLITIDKSAGSATGYVAKYVSKNIDGEGDIGAAEDWETGKAVNDGIRRVDAWAALHSIRQFQQIGGPPVGAYRELRRAREPSDDACIERARKAADAGDWRAFIYAASFEGIRAGRRINVKLARQETGERNKYGEEKTARLLGVRVGGWIEVTRKHSWRIQPCATNQAPGLASPRSLSCSPDSGPSPGTFVGCGNVHPHGGLAGLGLGDARRRACEGKPKRKGRGSSSRNPCGVAVVPSLRGYSGSSSSSFSPPWTRGNNCTQLEAAREFKEWETWINSWYRQHGRYPALIETLERTTKGGP